MLSSHLRSAEFQSLFNAWETDPQETGTIQGKWQADSRSQGVQTCQVKALSVPKVLALKIRNPNILGISCLFLIMWGHYFLGMQIIGLEKHTHTYLK